MGLQELVLGLALKAFAGVVLLFVARCVYNYVNSPFKSIPGHWSTAFSNIWRLVLNYNRSAQDTHVELHRKYGKVVRMGPNLVSLSDPALINTVFSTRKLWPKGEFYKPNDVMVNGMRISNLFSTRDEQYHTMAMKPVRGLYSMSTTASTIEPHVDRMLALFMRTIDERFARGTKSVDMAEYLPYFAWDSMSQMTVGKAYGLIESGKDKNDIIGISTRGLDYFSVVSQIPRFDFFLDKNPITRIGAPSFLWATIFAFQVLGERRAEPPSAAANRDKDYLDAFLELSHTNPKVVDDNMVVQYLLSNVLAGSDTTGVYMVAALYHLLKNPAAHQRVKEEIRAAGLPAGAVPWKTLNSQMPYFEAVMRETARVHPGVGICIERDVPAEGFTLPDGRFLPGGSVVGMNPWVVNRSEEYYGPDTDAFRPERWLRQEGEGAEAFDARRRRMLSADMTFGAGKRTCLGKNIAVYQAWKMTAALFNSYDIELANPNEDWTIHNAWFMYQYNVPCKLIPRKA